MSSKSGYSTSFALQTKLNKLVAGNGNGGDAPVKKKSNDIDILASMMEQCTLIEKENEDPDQANFAGLMGAFMEMLLK